MRLILIFTICLLTLSLSGQEKKLKSKNAKVSINSKSKLNTRKKVDINSPLRVVDLDTNKPASQPAYFIDGKYFNQSILKTLNLQFIDSMTVIKEEITLEDKIYYGQIHIKMKEEYVPKIVSLADLKSKYLKLGQNPSIFIIDNDVVKSDYNEFLIDENYILKIETQVIKNEKEKLNVNVIRLVTKTKENIEEANKIWIRGVDTDI
ncbi:hypothetical protein OU798_16440 [Prolixibacteraceae bacterium Z1-6]|uniref:Uncharacterized protein n=1 Tax=Draconibacterium aestuarii TaxID=2998507 RepID=A0A9X3F7F1_9BACT|nr:hypothetical protein [Prolixibacteraceae bacterium Z1-6]